MATNIIETFTFLVFFDLWGKKNLFDFLEIGNIFVNKKGANHELMTKSQFSLDSNEYFSKK